MTVSEPEATSDESEAIAGRSPGRPNRVLYSCVLAGYDRVLPPVRKSPGVDYVLFTDDPTLEVPGWDIRRITLPAGKRPHLLNREIKFFPEKYLPGYDASIYIDGNLRVQGCVEPLFAILGQGFDIVLFRHPERTRVDEEIKAVIQYGKAPADVLYREYEALLEAGFRETGLLSENNMLLRRHGVEELHRAMTDWWQQVSGYSGRDQLSLHFFLQRHRCRTLVLPIHAREPNPFFCYYPHLGRWGGRLRGIDVSLAARRCENPLRAALHSVWSGLRHYLRRPPQPRHPATGGRRAP